MFINLAIKIVAPQPEDAVGIARLQKVTWRATYPSPEHGISEADIVAATEGWNSPEAVARIRKRIINPPKGAHRLVAKDGARIVGHSVAQRGEVRNRLALLYVLPEYQGRGVGTSLLQAMLDWLGEDKEITLEVAQYNDKAIKFYQRLGFTIIGDAQNEVAKLPSGAVIPEWEMMRPAKT